MNLTKTLGAYQLGFLHVFGACLRNESMITRNEDIIGIAIDHGSKVIAF
jgi:hypothetical protein